MYKKWYLPDFSECVNFRDVQRVFVIPISLQIVFFYLLVDSVCRISAGLFRIQVGTSLWTKDMRLLGCFKEYSTSTIVFSMCCTARDFDLFVVSFLK